MELPLQVDASDRLITTAKLQCQRPVLTSRLVTQRPFLNKLEIETLDCDFLQFRYAKWGSARVRSSAATFAKTAQPQHSRTVTAVLGKASG